MQETLFHNQRGNFGSETLRFWGLMGYDTTPSLLNRSDNRRHVHRVKCSQVDHFDCDVFYVADRAALIRTLTVLPEYLRNAATASGAVFDQRSTA